MADTPLFFLIAGEASGDLLGARLIRALKTLTDGKAQFAGIGGPRMRAEGIDLFFPQEELAHFGLFELLRHVPHLLKRMKQTEEEIKRRCPAALITIDAPDFCFRVARELKGRGIPLIHYVAPTVWAWRPGRAKKIARFLDHLLALLPFEPPYFTREGLACTFVGHPIVESDAGNGNGARFRAKYDISPGAPLLTILPGSRMSEVSRLMPIFGDTLKQLVARHPRLRLVVPVTANVASFVKAEIEKWPLSALVVEGDEDKYDAFAASNAALACSGTIAIELAMARLPSVVAYKISQLTASLYRRLIKAKFASLVNIMHDRMIVPEMIQENCTPEKLIAEVDKLLSDEAARNEQIAGLADVAKWLGAGQFAPSERAAKTVLTLARATGEGARAISAAGEGTTRPFTVLQVVPALVTGGVERGTVEVAAALTAAGHRAIVVSSGGPMADEVEEVGGVHIHLPLTSKNPLTLYENSRHLANIIRERNVDIVHARSRAPAWSAFGAAQQTGKPFVTTFHNAYGARNWLKRRYNSVMARGARVIAISNFVGDYATRMYGVPRNRLRVIHRGVDIAHFDPVAVAAERIDALRKQWDLPTDERVIMLPGRLTRWKGQLVLVEALRLMNWQDVVAVIVGGGRTEFRQEIEQAAKAAGIGSIVRMVDTCRDMPAAFMLADVVVSASTRPEGFGRVIAEAQAMGRPVIATDHGGARESIIAGETGWLVPPSDAAALARTLTLVLTLTPAERAVLAQRSMAHIRANFTTALMTAQTLAVYGELMHLK